MCIFEDCMGKEATDDDGGVCVHDYISARPNKAMDHYYEPAG